MKVSIIIPVYNVENYLRQCIDSVVNQDYEDLEIILVNDGSTDSSGEICDEYKQRDRRINVIHKSNSGLMAAWKTGFFSSKGEYIGFVDSDDWIDTNMYDQLLKNALLHDADIVVCQLSKEYEGKKKSKVKEKLRLQPGVYDKERINSDILTGVINNGAHLERKLSPNRVTKLFKRNIIRQNIEFCDDSISLGEDLVTCFSCVCDAEKIVILDNFYPYHYRINNQSITGKYDKKRIDKVKRLNSKLREIANCKNINIKDQIANDYISLALLCIESEILHGPFTKKNIKSRIKNISKSEFFINANKNGNTQRFSLKYRVYLFLIKYERFGVLYFLRKCISYVR